MTEQQGANEKKYKLGKRIYFFLGILVGIAACGIVEDVVNIAIQRERASHIAARDCSEVRISSSTKETTEDEERKEAEEEVSAGSSSTNGAKEQRAHQKDLFENYPLSYRPYKLRGHQYFLPGYAMHRPAVREFLGGRYFEEETHCIMEQLFPEFPGSMVHAGVFFGDMLPHFATIVKGVSTEDHQYKVYAFEPNTRNYLLAQKAVEANQLSSAVLVNAALGPIVGQAMISTKDPTTGVEKGGGSNVVKASPNSKYNPGDFNIVPQLTIDMFNITDLSVIALDTEGFESFVLQGAMRTIKDKNTRPVVVALEDKYGEGRAFMKKNLQDEYVFIQDKNGLNYFCVPEAKAAVQKILRNGCRGVASQQPIETSPATVNIRRGDKQAQ